MPDTPHRRRRALLCIALLLSVLFQPAAGRLLASVPDAPAPAAAILSRPAGVDPALAPAEARLTRLPARPADHPDAGPAPAAVPHSLGLFPGSLPEPPLLPASRPVPRRLPVRGPPSSLR